MSRLSVSFRLWAEWICEARSDVQLRVAFEAEIARLRGTFAEQGRAAEAASRRHLASLRLAWAWRHHGAGAMLEAVLCWASRATAAMAEAEAARGGDNAQGRAHRRLGGAWLLWQCLSGRVHPPGHWACLRALGTWRQSALWARAAAAEEEARGVQEACQREARVRVRVRVRSVSLPNPNPDS